MAFQVYVIGRSLWGGFFFLEHFFLLKQADFLQC